MAARHFDLAYVRLNISTKRWGHSVSELLRQQPTISLQLAMHALQGALDKAQEEQVRISVVIVDASGQPIHSAHMDLARICLVRLMPLMESVSLPSKLLEVQAQFV
jgi:uncharacterized protein with PhoU and TrkA domain